jgi:hypothetical protein
LPERLKDTSIPTLEKIPTHWSDITYYVQSEAGTLLKRAIGEELCEINLKVRKYDIDHYYKFSLQEEVKDMTTKY